MPTLNIRFSIQLVINAMVNVSLPTKTVVVQLPRTPRLEPQVEDNPTPSLETVSTLVPTTAVTITSTPRAVIAAVAQPRS